MERSRPRSSSKSAKLFDLLNESDDDNDIDDDDDDDEDDGAVS